MRLTLQVRKKKKKKKQLARVFYDHFPIFVKMIFIFCLPYITQRNNIARYPALTEGSFLRSHWHVSATFGGFFSLVKNTLQVQT